MGVIRTMARAARPLPLVVGIFLITPGSGSGQDPLGTPLGDRPELRALLIAPHAELGVVLGQTVGRALESLREFRLGPVGTHGLELVEMNPGLGRYFGVDTGVLVADVAAESSLGLQPGDVILSIDGRTPRNPGHERAILASYQDDEEMEIEIMRDRRTRTVRATASQ